MRPWSNHASSAPSNRTTRRLGLSLLALGVYLCVDTVVDVPRVWVRKSDMRRKESPPATEGRRLFAGFPESWATLVGVSSVLVSAVDPEADMPGVMVVPAELGGFGIGCFNAERVGGGRAALRCGEGVAAVGGPCGVPPRKCGVRDTCSPIAICSMVGRDADGGERSARAAVDVEGRGARDTRSAGVVCIEAPHSSSLSSVRRRLCE